MQRPNRCVVKHLFDPSTCLENGNQKLPKDLVTPLFDTRMFPPVSSNVLLANPNFRTMYSQLTGDVFDSTTGKLISTAGNTGLTSTGTTCNTQHAVRRPLLSPACTTVNVTRERKAAKVEEDVRRYLERRVRQGVLVEALDEMLAGNEFEGQGRLPSP